MSQRFLIERNFLWSHIKVVSYFIFRFTLPLLFGRVYHFFYPYTLYLKIYFFSVI